MKKYKLIMLLVISLLSCACASPNHIRNFYTDGCSLFPDGNLKDRHLWCDCCFAHDIAYWRGGTKEERLRADEELRSCVQDKTNDKVLAETMFQGVRAGGHPAFPTWYRWAYGWTYGREYAPITNEEQLQVKERLDAYFAKHPTGYCGEKREKNK